MRIMLVEPNGALANALGDALDLGFHDVDVAPNPRDAAELLSGAEEPYDVIVLDDAATDGTEPRKAEMAGDAEDAAAADPSAGFVGLCRGTGARILLLRSAHRVTVGDARGADVWRDAARPDDATSDGDAARDGTVPDVDAVLDKPFTDSEFLARIHDLERPGAPRADGTPDMLACGALTLDTIHRRAYYDDLSAALPLSPREYGALEALVKADGRFLTFDELVSIVCGDGLASQREVMAQSLYSLANKLRRVGFFITKRGDRYRVR